MRRSNDKAETYALLDEIGVRGPAWRRTRSAAEVEATARELGYPGREVAFKPLMSSGSRGFRVLSASADRRRQLFENRPGVAEALRLEELVELLGDDRSDALVMELVTGCRKLRPADDLPVARRCGVAVNHGDRVALSAGGVERGDVGELLRRCSDRRGGRPIEGRIRCLSIANLL